MLKNHIMNECILCTYAWYIQVVVASLLHSEHGTGEFFYISKKK